MPTSTKMRRPKFKNMLQEGSLIGKCKQRLTDDYAYDAATDFGATEYMPAHYFPSFSQWLEQKNLAENFQYHSESFETQETKKKYRREYESVEGIKFDDETVKMSDIYEEGNIITVYVHSNLSYEFKKA